MKSQSHYKEIFSVAFPLIISTGSWSVFHFIDRMFLAWYSPEAIAAAMPAGILNFTLMSLFMGSVGYVSTFVAQYRGAKQVDMIGPAVWQGIYLALLGGVVITSLIPFSDTIFAFIGHAPEIAKEESRYFSMLCVGAMPIILCSAFSGYFSGLGKTTPVMAVTLVSSFANIILDYILIFGVGIFPEMGIAGAGLATSISAFLTMILYICIIVKTQKRFDKHKILSKYKFNKEIFLRLVKFGVPGGIHFFLDVAVFTVFILMVGNIGSDALIISNIAFGINTLAFMPLIGVGIAVSVLTGKYIGAKEPETASKIVFQAFKISLIYMTAMSLLYAFVPKLFLYPFLKEYQGEVYNTLYNQGAMLLKFVAIYSVFDTMNVIFGSALKGAGDTKFAMLNNLIISLLLMIIPVGVAIFVFDKGLVTSWVFATIYVCILALSFWIRFIQGKWKTMKVIEEPVIPTIPVTMPESPVEIL